MRITVVITVYNLSRYISLCLDDLQKQTFQDFDVLVIDDCSIDNTLVMIEPYYAFFGERLKVVSTGTNLGMPALARNYALDSGLINGEYVLFLDGDDRIDINMLEKLNKRAIEEDADIVICAFDRVDEKRGKAFSVEMKQFGRSVFDGDCGGDSIAYINTSPWNKLFKYEIIRIIRFPAFRVGEEVSFNFRAYTRSRRIAFTDDVLIHYNVRDNSVISNTSEDTIWRFWEELDRLRTSERIEYRPIVDLLIFFHIGLSMALRAADNREIDLNSYIKKVRLIFKKRYNMFKDNPYLKLTALSNHGFKGVVIWVALVSYRFNLFLLGLKLYRTLGFNMKF